MFNALKKEEIGKLKRSFYYKKNIINQWSINFRRMASNQEIWKLITLVTLVIPW